MPYNLCIDVGNTQTKFALFDNRELIHVKAISNKDLKKNNKLFGSYEPKSIIISSVNSDVEENLILSQFNNVIRLTEKTKLPIELEYQTPETLGKDRIAGVVGAYSLFPNQAVLVIDAGTCLTYDFLTKEKQYLGGAISPGVQMRLKAMNSFTNKLPLINWEGKIRPQTTGNSTITSLLSGAINGMLSEIKGFINDYKNNYKDLQVLITGGDSTFFEKELKNGIFANPNLVLIGLNEILIYNCK